MTFTERSFFHPPIPSFPGSFGISACGGWLVRFCETFPVPREVEASGEDAREGGLPVEMNAMDPRTVEAAAGPATLPVLVSRWPDTSSVH